MRMYQIEVDEQIYNYLKGKAEPFIDTPNTVLRKELLGEKEKLKQPLNNLSGSTKDVFPLVPTGTPKALLETLQVTYLVRHFNLKRSAATHKVSSIHHVATQTIIDKYTRQLNLTTLKFDKLLEQPELTDLKEILNRRFSKHKAVIKAYIDN